MGSNLYSGIVYAIQSVVRVGEAWFASWDGYSGRDRIRYCIHIDDFELENTEVVSISH